MKDVSTMGFNSIRVENSGVMKQNNLFVRHPSLMTCDKNEFAFLSVIAFLLFQHLGFSTSVILFASFTLT